MKADRVGLLRSGNYVDINGSEIPIWAAGISEYENDRLELSLIPLTEEWLLKFGASYSNEYKDYSLGIIRVDKDNGMGDYMVFIQILSIASIEYVHQLQNLYYALTNEELTTKQ